MTYKGALEKKMSIWYTQMYCIVLNGLGICSSSVTYSWPCSDTLHSSPEGQLTKKSCSHMIIYLESDWLSWIRSMVSHGLQTMGFVSLNNIENTGKCNFNKSGYNFWKICHFCKAALKLCDRDTSFF